VFSINLSMPGSVYGNISRTPMKKIDILNFITNFRKAPNDIKTYSEILNHLGASNEGTLKQLLAELQQTRVLKEIEKDGQSAYQVVTK
jgi:hypothetical protein